MSRETLSQKQSRAVRVIDALDVSMPEAKIELDSTSPLELMVAVILSAQCTDKRVNLVTPALFKRYPNARAYAQADTGELEGLIRSCGFFRMKAKNIQAAARELLERHGGEVPTQRAELELLPGVGKKTAGVVAIHLGQDYAFPVDTHVGRLARRLGFSTEEDPDKVEADLSALLPRERWFKGHQLLVWHGRRTCYARSPECERCVVNTLCPKLGVPGKKTKAAKKLSPLPPTPRRAQKKAATAKRGPRGKSRARP